MRPIGSSDSRFFHVPSYFVHYLHRHHALFGLFLDLCIAIALLEIIIWNEHVVPATFAVLVMTNIIMMIINISCYEMLINRSVNTIIMQFN